MDMSGINTVINNIDNATVVPLLHSFGVQGSPAAAGLLNSIGIICSAIITVLIVVVGVLSYIRGSQLHPFFTTYEDNPLVRGKIGMLIGVFSVICSVWFLFSLIYIYSLS